MSSNRKNRDTTAGARLGLETLESRTCFADVSYIGGLTQQLTITGSDAADNITIISFADAADRFRVLSGGVQIFQGSNGLIKKVVVDLKGGNDIFEMKSGAANIYQDIKTFDVKLGAGNNIARLNYVTTNFYNGGSLGAPTYGDWTINMTSGTNTDDVTVNMGRRISGKTALSIDLGGGNDFYTGGIAGNTDDGLTRISVYGNSGNDSLVGGVGADYFYGGNDNDTLRGGAGNDTLVGGAQVDQLFGEDGADFLDGSGFNTSDGARDILVGGAGTDTFKQYGLGEDQLVDRSFSEVVIDVGGVFGLPSRR